LYGTNAKAETPLGFISEGCVSAPPGTELPRQYACNKGIGQLTAKDIQDVREALAGLAHRCHFQVLNIGGHGETEPHPSNGEYSLITINGSIYDRALLRQTHNATENALIDLDLAMTMLHKVAHALNITYMGNRLESFFEGSLVAEHGWELESRLCGLVAKIASKGGPLQNPPKWYPWQTREFFKRDGYDSEIMCRSEWKLPKKCPTVLMDPVFAVKLCSDDFWEGEYLQRGAIALIPDVVQDLCRAGKGDIVTKGIPLSIRELFRQNTGEKSYAEKKYSGFARPESGFRKAFRDPYDEASEYEVGEDEPEIEWSEGEGPDASGYNTEEMTDVDDDDDDATICGSDGEMTEVEEWVRRAPKPIIKDPAAEADIFDLGGALLEMRNFHKTQEWRDMGELLEKRGLPVVTAKVKDADSDIFDLEGELREMRDFDRAREFRELEKREAEERKHAFFSDGP
jgi:hypothetical protein